MKKKKKKRATVQNESAPRRIKTRGSPAAAPRVLDNTGERARCFYCGDPVIPSRVERDHFPKPASAGGIVTVVACPQCHDLKDRTNWRDLPIEMKAEFFEEFAGMSRTAKIVFAQLLRVGFEHAEALKSVMKVRVSSPEVGVIDELTGPPSPLADYVARLVIPYLREKKLVTLHAE